MRPLPSLDVRGGAERCWRSVSALKIVVEAVWRSWRLHWGSLRMRLNVVVEAVLWAVEGNARQGG